VSIDIDTARPLRRPAELKGLVEAVFAALAQDEAEWVEWKGPLDLMSAEAEFSIAKQILGSANRPVDRAARFMGGLGYVIVGAEPGDVAGINPIDADILEAKLAKYLGPAPPVWAPTYLTVDGKHVLVIVVEPPKWGDPTFLLHKAWKPPQRGQGANEATVFIRGQAGTKPATATEALALQERARRGAVAALNELALKFLGEPQVIVTMDVSINARNHWINEKRRALLATLPAKQAGFQGSYRSPGGFDAFLAATQATSSIHRLFESEPEKRTVDEFKGEIENYLTRAKAVLSEACMGVMADAEVNEVRLVLVNPTDHNLPDVELKLYIPGQVWAFDDGFPAELPPDPWPYGKPRPSDLMRSMASGVSVPRAMLPFGAARPPTMWITNGGSVSLRFKVGHMRPHGEAELDTFTLVTAEPPGAVLDAQWSITSTALSGVGKGTLAIQLSSTAATPIGLLAVESRSSDDDDD
jgi:hypothetical protein